MRLHDVQHQDRALSILWRALHSGRTHHAYLFEGPEGVGKEMAARAMAARLLCQATDIAADADACGQCESCRLLMSDNHPDFQVIHRKLHKLHPDRAVRASKGLFLVVDLIRFFLIERAASKPNLGGRRVFLILEAERMNEGAQNALLKTLEEPPGETCLILVTAAAERLLPTIRSRCQRVPFGLLPPAFVEARLADQFRVPPDAATTLARLADGRLGVALAWHRSDVLPLLDEVGACIDQLGGGDPTRFSNGLVETANVLAARTRSLESPSNNVDDEAAENDNNSRGAAKAVSTDELRTALKLTLALVAAIYRDALVAKAGADAARHLPRQQRRTDALAARHSADHLDACIQAVTQAERMLDQNVAPPLVCEHLAVALAGDLPVC